MLKTSFSHDGCFDSSRVKMTKKTKKKKRKKRERDKCAMNWVCTLLNIIPCNDTEPVPVLDTKNKSNEL